MTDQVGTAATSPGVAHAQQHTDISSDSAEYYQHWLDTLAMHLPFVGAATLYLPVDGHHLPIAQLISDHDLLEQVMVEAQNHFDARQPQVTQLAGGTSQQTLSQPFGLFYPVRDVDEKLLALVAVAVSVKTQEQLTDALSAMQWSVASLEVNEYQQRLARAEAQNTHNGQSVAILSRVLSEKRYGASATRLVTELAQLFHCDRVSLGRYNGRRSTLTHLSHSAQFGKKMNHVRLIEAVMDECIDIGEIVLFDPNEASRGIDHAQKALSTHLGQVAILGIPLYRLGEVYGAIICEAQPEQRFSESMAEHVQSIASLVLPAVEDKRQNDRIWLIKTAVSIKEQLKRLFGPRYLGRKLLLIGLCAVGYGLATVETDYRLAADARIEYAELRAIVAPYDGFIDEAAVRAGDNVTVGDPLVRMDDKDLRLEKLKWLSEQSKLNRQYLEALSLRDRAQLNIIGAQQQQVEAQLALIDSQLERGQLRAPYDGVVASGDLSQRLGSAVTKGDLLFEVAPEGQYRVQLQVNESRIADLELGQQGVLYLSALPETGFDFTVAKLTSLTEVGEGGTDFLVEAELDTAHAQLQAGMEGVGRIEIDRQLAVAVWSRDLVEWARLKYWSWWG